MSLRISLNRLEEWPGLVRLAARFEAAARLAAGSGGEPRGEVSLTFLPDAEMRALHRRWLGRDATTDVLCFDLGEGEGGVLLADVYVAPATAERNARAHGVATAEEVTRLVIHGVLHALGHRHPEDEARYDSPMFRLQEELLRRLPPG